MAPPTALITGILGQDGTYLSALLQARGWHVVGLARPGSLQRPLEPLRRQLLGQAELRELDLANGAALAAVVSALRPQRIYHLAAVHHSSEGTLQSDPAPATLAAMTAVNFAAVERLAATIAAGGLGTHLVAAASSQIWTPGVPAQMVDEESPRQPANYYGLTKCWAMDCLAYYRARLGLHASTAILFNHESPLRAKSFVSRKITLAAARAARAEGEGEPLALGNLGARVDWTAAEDTVAAMAAMAEAQTPADYVIASGGTHAVGELAEIAFAQAGLDWRRHVRGATDQPQPHLVGNPERAQRTLGWRPQIAFADLIRAMVDSDLGRLEGKA